MKKFSIGIDLGTTNSVLAFLDLENEEQKVQIFSIPQITAPHTVESLTSLPSFIYAPTKEEIKSDMYHLPWSKESKWVSGEWARKKSAESPFQTVVGAKSWLAYHKVNRTDPILPFNAPETVSKISPVDASAFYIQHLVNAWNHQFPDHQIKNQQVVLTVPASFDASAKELTYEAAHKAGLPDDFILLEEPQAAVYSWLSEQGEQWRSHLNEHDIILVADIGGGTTDFSTIRVESEEGNLILTRIAVGKHLLIGGDNMDLLLAHLSKNAFFEKGIEVDPWQSVALWHSCRIAKETLLSETKIEKHPVSLLGKGSRLIKGTISVDLNLKTVSEQILEGFFPLTKIDELPEKQKMTGFLELGLPFEKDTAITKHMAQFLNTHGTNGETLRPTKILFNGGVLQSPILKNRMNDVLTAWFPEHPPKLLTAKQDLLHAVAKGAAYYGLVKQGRGIRIRGGVARSYYIGIETTGLALPGAARPLRALCVVPYGMEEGTECDIPGSPIGAVVGAQAIFPFFSSNIRKDPPGYIPNQKEKQELEESDSLQTTLTRTKTTEKEEIIPVRFRSKITELGILELWCVSIMGNDQWKLEFNVREHGTK